MNTPIVLIMGEASSGKDTFAGMLAKQMNGICIAQADPLKRFAMDVFGFTTEQLWGPSERRNELDSRYDLGIAWDDAESALTHYAEYWLTDLLGTYRNKELNVLDNWFLELKTNYFKNNKSINARIVLQSLGTQGIRAIKPTAFVDYTISASMKLLAGGYGYDKERGLYPNDNETGPGAVLVTDGRFKNELLKVKSIGGTVINIVNPSNEAKAVDMAGIKGHRSEAELKTIPSHFFDMIVINDKTRGLEHLENTVGWVVRDLIHVPTYGDR
jgi:hypothetical protein